MPPSPFFTIPHTAPFLASLARGIFKLIPQPEELARATIYLPYARAAKTFRKYLVREAPQGTLLMPRIDSLREIEGEGDRVEEGGASSPILHPFERIGQLTHLIRQQQIAETSCHHTPLPPFMTTVRLSQAFIRLLDQAAIEEVDLSAIYKLVPEEFAAHWQITLDSLQVILEVWPHYCKEHTLLEPYPAYQQKIAHLLTEWEKEPPQYWVIIAGSTGTMPTTARMMKAISTFPKGCIVLPGFRPLPSPESLAPTHPQYGLNRLLKYLHISPLSVERWPSCIRSDETLEGCLERTFQDTIPAPPSSSSLDLSSLEKITAIACNTLEEESLVIALLLRNTLETPEQHATLVTSNRTLIRYVQEHLKRWKLTIEDSAGTSLHEAPLARLMLLMLDLLASHETSLIPLLAVLKHPLTGLSFKPPLKLHWVYLLEQEVLRGLLPPYSFLLNDLSTFPLSPHRKMLQKGMSLLVQSLADLFELASHPTPPSLTTWIKTHLTSVTSLMRGGDAWQTEGGQFLNQTLLELGEKGHAFGNLSLQEYRELLKEIFQSHTFLDTTPSHPRLHILGTLEARLLPTEVMILSDLNEGSWPAEDPLDPWLSRSMRDTLGLPPPERRVALMAHDFCQAFSAHRLILTRSIRLEGTPSIPSRFWLRLQTALETAGTTLRTDPLWRSLAHQLYMPERLLPETPACACPPLSARPQQLSVTQIETWRRDPYGLYARHVLKLKPLKPLDQKLDAALFGTLIHHICEEMGQVKQPLTFEGLIEKGRILFAPYHQDVSVHTFWWPRFEHIAHWLVESETRKRRRSPVQESLTEIRGKIHLPHTCGTFTLTTRADRLDVLADGTVDLIDYKTGALPREADIQSGFSPQLPLEAAIFLNGGFSIQPHSLQLNTLSYWALQGRGKNHMYTLKGDPHQAASHALQELKELIENFNNPHMPYLAQPLPQYAPLYNDYAYLERLNI